MIFGWKKNSNIVTMHCEFCGTIVNKPFWSGLFSVDYIIFLKNKMVSKVNYKEQIVNLANGQKLDFIFDFGNESLAMPYRAKIHLLCSEKCENDFLSQNRGTIMNPSIYEKTPIFSFRKSNIFKPSVAPLSRLRTITKVCEICKNEYPDFDIDGWEKKWVARSLLKKDSELVKNNMPPSFCIEEYDQILSGVSEQSPEGYYFAYSISEEKTSHSFCSYDCAFVYSRGNNAMVIVDSVLEKDRIGAIVPETEEFNKNLNNPIPHRPSFFAQL